MTYQIVPTTEQHVDGFERVFDTVARELRYLAFTQAPPRQKVVEFLTESLTGGWPHFVALHDGVVVGWCDVNSSHQPAWIMLPELQVPQEHSVGAETRFERFQREPAFRLTTWPNKLRP